jgi:hypothetical protein
MPTKALRQPLVERVETPLAARLTKRRMVSLCAGICSPSGRSRE